MTNPRPVGPATSVTSSALSQSVLLGGNSAAQGQMYLRVSFTHVLMFNRTWIQSVTIVDDLSFYISVFCRWIDRSEPLLPPSLSSCLVEQPPPLLQQCPSNSPNNISNSKRSRLHLRIIRQIMTRWASVSLLSQDTSYSALSLPVTSSVTVVLRHSHLPLCSRCRIWLCVVFLRHVWLL